MSEPYTGRPEAECVPIEPMTASALKGWLSRAEESNRRWVETQGFEAKPGSVCQIPGADGGLSRVLAGVDRPGALYALGGLPYALPRGDYRLDCDWEAAHQELALVGWALGAYRFSRYKKPDREPARLAFPQGARRDRIRHLAGAVTRVRDLINTPTEDMGPAELAAVVAELADAHGGRCTQVTGDELMRLGFPAVHAVGRASHRPPRMVELTWGQAGNPEVAIVGKGVCFDTGGLDIKGSEGMRLMKKDMGGAAHAIALAELIMAQELPIQVRLLVPAVENAIGPEAYRPGDVVPTRNGLMVEIGNTDAEGRVILADALTAAAEERPALILDFATLTGAARIALGADLPATYANDEELGEELIAAGERTDDPLWRMPLYEPYQELLDSSIADVSNMASTPFAGSITAALFLQRFVLDDVPWAHLDVFGWNQKARAGRPEGGEAFGVRAAFDYLERRFKAA